MKDESPPMFTAEKNTLVFWEDAKQNGMHPGQYNRVLMVRVSVAGDNKSDAEYWVEEEYPEEHPHPVFGKIRKNEQMFQRFGQYIEKYKEAGAAGIVAGTPIEAWPMVNRVQVAMLKHHGVHSVEALAEIHDGLVSTLGMDGRSLREKAKNFLSVAENTAAGMKALAEKQALEERLAAVEAKYLDLAETLAELPEETKAEVKKSIARKSKDRIKDAA